MTATAEGDTRRGDRLTSEEALADAQMLVVLGGPGAGKTWLARRYARQAAGRALAALEDGASLEEVELPLVTTWDRWVKMPAAGGLREGLVQAPFAAGVDDLGAGVLTERLRRTFTLPDARVLVIVDSLDEAAEVPAQGRQWTRLRDLSSLHTWRVVLTSRFGAWQATNRGVDDQARVVEIEELTYPDDVGSLVSSWFAEEPQRADMLLAQIEARPELQRAAVIPLMLTFYCLLAEDGRTIPSSRRDLYTQLVDKLLSARWVDDQPDAPDLDYCRDLLRRWAWAAVGEAVTPVGLGNWADSFTQPEQPRHDQTRAIDHVAPRVTDDGGGHLTRRFVHRTLLEHFVAEHLATLDTQIAAQLLLPHLWFDPDWEVAAPAAIAAHPDRDTLLEMLLPTVPVPVGDPARAAVAAETDRLVLGIAAESLSGDWHGQSRDLIHAARVRHATDEHSHIAATSHWTDSNPEVLTAVLAALPTAGPSVVGALAGVVPALAPTEAQRGEALTAVLAALPTTGPYVGARAALLRRLSTADGWLRWLSASPEGPT